MNKKLIAVSILSALLLSAPAMAQEEDEGWSIGGTIAGTTDYVFRGVSQTAEDPALQGSIDIGHSSGFYAGVWGSNVDFEVPGDGINTEIDVYVGWVFSLPSDVELDLQAVRYIYPGSNSGFNIDYNEYIAALSVSYFTGTIAYSDDFVNSGADSLYYELAGEFPVGETGFNITATVGYSDVEEATDDNYTSYQVGVNYSWNNILLDVSYYDTSSYGEGLQDFLGPKTWADSRVVFTASYEF
jgi:uncharacterized protein (TIGR02001 family)